MASTYKVYTDDSFRCWDITATSFAVEDGVLLFYDEDEDTLTKEPEPTVAFSEWQSVHEQ